jgi:hypothetical protein
LTIARLVSCVAAASMTAASSEELSEHQWR